MVFDATSIYTSAGGSINDTGQSIQLQDGMSGVADFFTDLGATTLDSIGSVIVSGSQSSAIILGAGNSMLTGSVSLQGTAAQSYSGAIALGSNVAMDNVHVTGDLIAAIDPTSAITDGFLRLDKAQGTGAAGFFEKKRSNAVDVPVALRVDKAVEAGGVKLAPEARAAWIYAARKNRSEISYGPQGANAITRVYGVNPGRNRYQIGAGLKAKWNDRFEAGVDCDFEWCSKYRNHSLSVNVGISF